jgi:hypothetical protein
MYGNPQKKKLYVWYKICIMNFIVFPSAKCIGSLWGGLLTDELFVFQGQATGLGRGDML